MNEHLRRSRKQEKRGAKLYGGSLNSGSGNGPRKNDIRTSRWSIEFKTTTADSYRLKHDDLVLAAHNALREGRTFLFGIDFASANLTGNRAVDRYVIMAENDILELFYDLERLELALAEAREVILDREAELSIVRMRDY